MKKEVSLVNLADGESATVIAFEACHGGSSRLEAMGIRIGKKIKKLGGMFLRGPITIEIGQTRLGIGHGLAAKVIVEPDQ
ncbi:ferrous iron transport protein A [Candidatus Saganbacteria bacterium CG08_land_8_20_14_0_20_45_16]|uniref:Ferrous iron transport protein A n=1 Tax=Candidatus Saganbacteria bacterium CG08_land_8_20_14_0_20_45_16 TaxID=2014293 RepID=A0A2H0XUV0_UNCSA|nr:MAG: ferrous iron transport protein A [Candidatus Saganbacteria bacterium CG08_land_8_20_14_0_20_45_16]